MKKLVVLFLTLSILLTAFVACIPAETPDESSSNVESSSQPESTPGSSVESSTEAPIGNLDPDLDLGGKEVCIISRNDPWMIDEVSVEGTTGDPINDAIFQRNLNVESLLKVEIDNVLSTGDDYSVVTALKNTAGPDCPYHIASSPAYVSFENTAAGLFHNLYDVGNVDLDQSYWSPKYNAEASIGNAQYFVTGSISLSLRRFIFVTFFNKDLAQKYGLEDLYKVVNEKRWTIEYQTNIVSNMYDDIDGIEGQTAGDAYGFLTDSRIFVDPYVASCDLQILVKDEDNFLAFNSDVEKADKMMGLIYNLFYKTGASWVFGADEKYSQFEKILNKFVSGEATMVTHRLIVAESAEMRGMESEYGILPIPKFDEDMSEYYSLAHDLFAVYGIVHSVDTFELDDIGAVLEAMAIESHKVVTPAYYEVALKGKYSKDPESWEMLDMIMNNLKINGGLLYTTKIGITHRIREAVKAKLSNANTIYNPVFIKGIEKNLTLLNDSIRDIQ